jgi:hypothetical protein
MRGSISLCIAPGQHQQRGIEKNLFALSHRIAMMLKLPGVIFVPVEAIYLREIGHPCVLQ